MRSAETIKTELAQAKEMLRTAEGRTTEVYSRIVGYYRSVRNWNKGKKEEYGERKLYDVASSEVKTDKKIVAAKEGSVLLFVRKTCPACPSAKEEVAKLSLASSILDTDLDEGLEQARSYQVLSTPTAIFLDASGNEIYRARDAKAIREFADTFNSSKVDGQKEKAV